MLRSAKVFYQKRAFRIAYIWWMIHIFACLWWGMHGKRFMWTITVFASIYLLIFLHRQRIRFAEEWIAWLVHFLPLFMWFRLINLEDIYLLTIERSPFLKCSMLVRPWKSSLQCFQVEYMEYSAQLLDKLWDKFKYEFNKMCATIFFHATI